MSRLTDVLARYSELGIAQQLDYEKLYRYSIITHSTAIEGSTVTEIENQLLFDEGISDYIRSQNDTLNPENDTLNDTLNLTEKERMVNDTLNLTEKERMVLTLIRKDSGITIARMMEAAGCSRPTVIRALRHLQERGLIRRVGAKKNGFWEIVT